MPGEPIASDLGLGAASNEIADKTSSQKIAPVSPLGQTPELDSKRDLIDSLSHLLGPQEGSPKTNIFWEGKGIRVTMPEKPIVPREEGLSFMVASDNTSGTWKDRDIKDVLRETYYSLPIARILSESLMGGVPDYWANIQLKSANGFEEGVNVIGRNPNS